MRFSRLSILIGVLVVSLLAAPVTLAQGGTASEKLHKLFDEDWNWLMTEFPEFATYAGVPGRNHLWTDQSLEAIERRNHRFRSVLKQIEAIDRAQLNPADQLNYDLYARFMREAVEGQRFPSDYLPISQLGGVQVDVAQMITLMPAFSVADFENIIGRLNGVARLVDQTIVLLNKGLEKKVTPPRVTLREVAGQIQNQIVDDPGKSPLLVPFQNMPESIAAADRERLKREAEKAVAGSVVPAYRKLHDYFTKTYLPATRESIGMSELPDGQAWYAYQARTSTTTNLSPEEIHQIGLREVKRIRAEMDKVMAETGFKGSFAEFRDMLLNDAKFVPKSGEECLALYRDIAKRADPEMVKLFATVPRLPYGVIAVPDYMAKSAPAAYYQPGSLEAGRPGNFFVNTYDLKTNATWQMEALVLHEAVPGHHFQTALQQELGEVPQFRRFLGNTAYGEGWGLYAESLGYEMGMYKDPYSKLGQLNYDVWRAVRLVLDTGLHSKGWTRQQAIDYFQQNTVISDHETVVEVDRYIVIPGQALGYKIGQLKFKELREYATRELGAKFNLRTFHDQLLGTGALPMEVLEARVKGWVAEQKQSRAGAN